MLAKADANQNKVHGCQSSASSYLVLLRKLTACHNTPTTRTGEFGAMETK
jgi:hypothetical protein